MLGQVGGEWGQGLGDRERKGPEKGGNAVLLLSLESWSQPQAQEVKMDKGPGEPRTPKQGHRNALGVQSQIQSESGLGLTLGSTVLCDLSSVIC